MQKLNLRGNRLVHLYFALYDATIQQMHFPSEPAL